jgi:hypothetical protein
VSRMPLLSQCAPVSIQDRVHKIDCSSNPPSRSFRSLPRRRQGAVNRLPYHPPVYPQLLRRPRDRPPPNSYSRRICSNSSTLALQSTEFPPLRASPESEYPFVVWVGQIKPPNWATSE